MRPLVEYLLSWIILAFFGGQVCPFLESLNLFQWALILFVAFALAFGIRAFLLQPLVYKAPETHRAARRFYLEFGLFVAAGLGVSAFNTLAFGFPFIGSGVLTVVLGYSVLGFFVATDLALQQERELARQFEASRSRAEDMGKYFPLTRKFILISSISVLSITIVTFLIISHDLSWLSEQMGTVNWASARRSVFLEVVFILSIFLLLITNLILSYSQNLRILLKNQIDTLEEVNRGKLDGFVPVFTNDEFAIIADHTNRMIEGLRVRTEELQLTQDVTILSLASLAETRDNETGAHILRTQHYVRILAEYLKTHIALDGQLSDEVIDLLFKSAPLHDVGKVGVPDAILLKPGRLDESEWKQMRLHPIYGFEALRVAEERLGTNSFLRLAREIAVSHHEKWDGSGYPKAIAGSSIPLAGRLMALADVYDALISKRVYKPAFSHEKAKQSILEGKGTHFDPLIVEAFLATESRFVEIAARYRNPEQV